MAPTRQIERTRELEESLRDRVHETLARYRMAGNRVRKLVNLPDSHEATLALRTALADEQAARGEYEDALGGFTRLVIHRKGPEVEKNSCL